MDEQSTIPASDTAETQPPVAEVRIPGVYKDDDLVYVDPKLRIVVGLVEWSKSGNPKSLLMKEELVEEDEADIKEAPAAKTAVKPDAKDTKVRRPRVRRQRFYPWGTYRSMKKIYKIEGKVARVENQKTLDDVMEKALKEPFWD